MTLTTGAGTTNQTTGQTTGGTTTNREAFATSSFSVTYDPQSGYRLADGVNSAAFGAAQFLSESSKPTLNPLVLYSSAGTGVEDYLALYKYQLDSPLVVPRYGATGGWQHTIVGVTTRETRLDYFAYGPATPVAAMPRTGSMRFFLFGAGNLARANDLYFTSGTGYLTVNFETGAVLSDLSITGTNFYRDEYGGLSGGRIFGTINGNVVEGELRSSIAAFTGRFRMLFVGPAADEVILIYYGQVNGSDGLAFVGSSVGVPNP